MPSTEAAVLDSLPGGRIPATGADERVSPERDSQLAAWVKACVARGEHGAAREHFAELIGMHQRRANRIALAYLRNPADADEAVQDAFIRVFTSIGSYREQLPFDQWFTRILVNGCIDRERARQRRERRLVPLGDGVPGERGRVTRSPEQGLFAQRWRDAVSSALEQLPDRQRSVFVLCHYGDHSPREVSAMTGIRESTVRVHLFRAVRKLRLALEDWREAR